MQKLKTKVAIIGAGPIGLTAALFLEKFNIDYKLIERNHNIMQHPAAHLINLRSMEIMKELNIDN
jgi:2-polyprenyl-6-methoxyphenol hydroxylase-like FAD-dependent oxidoreductase